VVRLKNWAGRVSAILSGLVGVAVVVALALLAIVGNVGTIADLLHLPIDPKFVLVPAVAVVAANVLWQEVKKRRLAETERDAAKAAHDAKPDPAAILREFLRLHDYGLTVLEPFHETIEQLPKTMPEGAKRYSAWIDECTTAIEQHRPAFALQFRVTVGAQLYPSEHMWVIVKDEDGKDVWVDMERVRGYEERVAKSMAVLAEVIRAG
jgi:hypothetical protein